MYDLIIIGGGVAGMTGAIYAARAGLSTAIIEKSGFGGQVTSTDKIENYPSLKEIDGFTLASNMKAQIDSLGVESIYAEVQKISKENDIFHITSDSKELEAKAVIISNGIKRRRLKIKGEEKFAGRGVSWCAVCDGGFFTKKTVAVIGGGNSALSDAIYLSNICEKVYLIFRRNEPTASKIYVDKVKTLNNITILPRTIPLCINGEKTVEKLEIQNLDTKEVSSLKVSGIFEAVGLVPDNKRFENILTLDENGYILTDENRKTSTEGLFAAGDTVKKHLRQIVTASSDGAIAATCAIEYLQEKGFLNE